MSLIAYCKGGNSKFMALDASNIVIIALVNINEFKDKQFDRQISFYILQNGDLIQACSQYFSPDVKFEVQNVISCFLNSTADVDMCDIMDICD